MSAKLKFLNFSKNNIGILVLKLVFYFNFVRNCFQVYLRSKNAVIGFKERGLKPDRNFEIACKLVLIKCDRPKKTVIFRRESAKF